MGTKTRSAGRGELWLIDAHRCSPDRLRSVAALRRLFREIVGGLDLHPVGRPRFLRFPGEGGVTALWMLRESHLACHTFPEHGSACLDLFSCHRLATWPWHQALGRALEAREITVRSLERSYRRGRGRPRPPPR